VRNLRGIDTRGFLRSKRRCHPREVCPKRTPPSRCSRSSASVAILRINSAVRPGPAKFVDAVPRSRPTSGRRRHDRELTRRDIYGLFVFLVRKWTEFVRGFWKRRRRCARWHFKSHGNRSNMYSVCFYYRRILYSVFFMTINGIFIFMQK